jgi:hypothetical protein
MANQDPASIRGYFKEHRELNKRAREIAEYESRQRYKQKFGTELGPEKTDAEKAAEEERINELKYGTFFTRVLPKEPVPHNYYKGPVNSTRVMAHKFVPSITETTTEGEKEVVSGDVFVRFARPSKQQGDVVIYKYSNVPVNVYEAFTGTYSKGRFINTTLEPFKSGPYSGPETADLE